MEITTIVCAGCKKSITARIPKDRKYCSLSCYRTSKRPQRRTGTTINCENCGEEHYVRKHQQDKTKNNFCSIECSNKFQKRNKIKCVCTVCKNDYYMSPSLHADRLNKGHKLRYCSMECRNKDKKILSKNSIMGNLAQYRKKGANKLELKGREILNKIGIEFYEQVPMFNKFVVDVVIKDKPLVIQWDGIYWHSKPKRKMLDKSQDAYLNKCGYNVIRITDKQISEDIENVYEIIRKTIQQMPNKSPSKNKP